MRPKENYSHFMVVGFLLTVGILISFQIYIEREPSRIDRQEEIDHQESIRVGKALYELSCAACHGNEGEGGVGPALNSRNLLATTPDETLVSLTRSGIPGTIMPAWGQTFGGPLTNEETLNLIAYIRSWEPTAPEIVEVAEEPDPLRGAAIYERTCFICHGANGQGTDEAPALNDPTRLSRLDNSWYRNTIIRGRPARGMPTWGTVLSPSQIDDLIALVDVWREGETVNAEISLATYLSDALFAIRDFDAIDAEFFLNAALEQADTSQAAEIREIIDLIRENQLFVAEGRVATLLPPEEMGQALYVSSCSVCHGSTGTGGLGPNLHDNTFIQTQTDDDLVNFLLEGRRGTPMNGFDGILAEDELQNVTILLRSWQGK